MLKFGWCVLTEFYAHVCILVWWLTLFFGHSNTIHWYSWTWKLYFSQVFMWSKFRLFFLVAQVSNVNGNTNISTSGRNFTHFQSLFWVWTEWKFGFVCSRNGVWTEWHLSRTQNLFGRREITRSRPHAKQRGWNALRKCHTHCGIHNRKCSCHAMPDVKFSDSWLIL